MRGAGNQGVMILAGELSGDMHGAALARELRRRRPDLRIFGMGGKHMRGEGVEILAEYNPVVGLVEIIGHFGAILDSFRKLKEALMTRKPALLVLIDYPEFNLKVAKVARRLGVRILYYISPQVWAWRRGRIRKIARLVNAMAVILPFEKELYSKEGLRTEYVGHPLMEELTEFRRKGVEGWQELGLRKTGRVLALLPGSRRGEIERHVGLLVETVNLLKTEVPGIQILVPVAPSLDAGSRKLLDGLAALGATLVEGRTPEILSVSEIALVASGTASLESALFGVPTVVYYRVQALTYILARLLIGVPYISLVNLILGREVIPEYIQSRATPGNLTRALKRFLEDNALKEETGEAFERVRGILGSSRTSEKAADLAEEIAGW